ncbi:tail fiber protein [uncultured Aquimarina sp.]|uniref:tail fiber protein n=1 Tax=uncultured Aquimarina sp. TaxID=575652 RepID=UPI00261A786E|nr:tail fiber protein [uncultured Aquimarina sp.]
MRKIYFFKFLLVLNAIVAYSQNLVDSSSWVVGSTATPSGFTNYGFTPGVNTRELGLGPNGEEVVLWTATPTDVNSLDGGFITTNVPIDNTKTYRLSVWIKKAGTNDGATYFGMYSKDSSDSQSTLNLDGTLNNNPYFRIGDLPTLNEWYLLVGFVHKSDYNSTVEIGGIYNTNGDKVLDLNNDFKFSTTSVNLVLRAFQNGTNTLTDREYFYDPRIEVVNGTETSDGENNNTATDPSNVFIGNDAGISNTTGKNNVFVGTNSGQSNTTGQTNVFVGRNSGRSNIDGKNNVFSGNAAGFGNISGNFNTFLGTYAGRENIDGKRNVFIGSNAGRNSIGNTNVFIGYEAGFNEVGNNKLYIENSSSDTPLVYGDFAKDQLGINTNAIPDGYNFAVGGGASIDGSIRAATLDIEAPDNSEDWLPVTIGREVKPFFRNFNFVVSPSTNTNELLGFSIIDKNLISRQDNYFRDDFSRVSYMTNRDQYFFSVGHNDREGQDRASIQMPLTNSKVVIAGFGDYLEDQNHKLIVKDGTALIENAIYTNGRIAIGTTEEDPGYALTVKGKVHVQEVKVDLLGVLAPDYVFKKEYDLKTLEEVQNYIAKEGHLPNIPSASEMEKEGVNLKEMNMKLLEKVEELTLYTIAQEKAIKEQKEANDSLEKRLQKLEELLQQ